MKFTEPLVPTLLTQEYTIDDYLEFIDKPLPNVKRLTLFSQWWLECFTFSYPWMPLLWLPFAIWEMISSPLPMFETMGTFAITLASWPLWEYAYHYGLFHSPLLISKPIRPLMTLHFLAHGIHHVTPQDSQRLFMPPAMFLTLYVASRYLVGLMAGKWICPIAAGVICSFICYDYFHFALHHGETILGKWGY